MQCRVVRYTGTVRFPFLLLLLLLVILLSLSLILSPFYSSYISYGQYAKLGSLLFRENRKPHVFVTLRNVNVLNYLYFLEEVY